MTLTIRRSLTVIDKSAKETLCRLPRCTWARGAVVSQLICRAPMIHIGIYRACARGCGEGEGYRQRQWHHEA